MTIAVLFAWTTACPAFAQQPDAEASVETDAERLRAVLAHYAHEPTVEWVVATALRHTSVHPNATQTLASRARASGWMPQLRVFGRFGTGTGQNQRFTDNLATTWTDDRDLSMVATLTFRLDRLVFAPEETPLLRQKSHLQRERWEMTKAITRVYFERRKLQVERDMPSGSAAERELKIAELEALLNVWTGGEFRLHCTKQQQRSTNHAAPIQPASSNTIPNPARP